MRGHIDKKHLSKLCTFNSVKFGRGQEELQNEDHKTYCKNKKGKK